MGQMMKIPAEAIELYNQFIHGEIDRRAFLKGTERFAAGGLTAAALVEALMPNYALGQQVRKDDERIRTSYESIPSPNGNGYIKGYFARPFSVEVIGAERPREIALDVPVPVRRGNGLIARPDALVVLAHLLPQGVVGHQRLDERRSGQAAGGETLRALEKGTTIDLAMNKLVVQLDRFRGYFHHLSHRDLPSV